MGVKLRKVVGVLLIAIALIAVGSTCYYFPEHTVTATITTTTTRILLKGDWGWDLVIISVLVILALLTGELLILSKPRVPMPVGIDD